MMGMMGGKGAVGSSGSTCSLPDFIKTGQRQSVNWKACWQAYCTQYGDGQYFDPARMDQSFITGFIDYVAVQALGSLGGAPKDAAAAPLALPAGNGMKRPGGPMPVQPPNKRLLHPNSGFGGGGGMDPQKAELVEQVKELQRQGPPAKTAWWDYAD